jgi:ParB-like chromosome segregation protein Spo0J
VRATDDDVMLRDALLENLHRAQLNPLEEAAAYDQLLTDFGCTHDELAGRIGRLPAADLEHLAAAAAAAVGAAPDRGRRALGRSTHAALLGLDDPAPRSGWRTDRGRRALGAQRRGDRRGRRRGRP